ncbi:MAG: proliferating cell nuclear antigen (pcna) [archaeon]
MELVIADAKTFKKCIEGIKVLIDEAEFLVNENGMTLKATDPSQISMIDFELNKSAFKSFHIEEPLKIGIDLDSLNQVMSRSKPGEELTLKLSDDKSRLNIFLKGKSKRNFSIPLIDISSAELPTPKIDFDVQIKVLAEILQDGLKDASLFSTHIVLGVEKDKFVLKAQSSKGELLSDTEQEKALLEVNAKTDAKAMYPLDYLQDMLKTASSETELELNLKNDAPIRISYSIGDAKITYFLAPRIESK